MIERSRSNPYEIGIAVSLLFLSVYGLLVTPASASLDRGMTEPMRMSYAILGVLGSTTTLVGLRLKDAHLGLIVEAVGQLFVGGGAATFVVVLCAVTSFEQSGLVTGTGAAISLSALFRVWQILRDVRRWQAIIAAAAGLQQTFDELGGMADDA